MRQLLGARYYATIALVAKFSYILCDSRHKIEVSTSFERLVECRGRHNEVSRTECNQEMVRATIEPSREQCVAPICPGRVRRKNGEVNP